ncbi:hypothetical protein GCM10018980_18200 [Streptomyces capoamus]|uniref:Uncharacterized protein n=1 Tax=Streptomyces capoamus TaxID=68183 RepID=A0A919EV09_9ACTN|nr:hypothetical protein GCM10010501_31820 [Streptomyces libani subsp. rufus]GHG42456.1 hypothetical protein GCM10018980_18200 [Streptomyces capoamus]
MVAVSMTTARPSLSIPAFPVPLSPKRRHSLAHSYAPPMLPVEAMPARAGKARNQQGNVPL